MSLSFDRVAHIYDGTRALPPDVPERIADAIVKLSGATHESKFFEPGIGTGRIALPFVRRGYSYTGVDISQGMLAELRAKVADFPHRLSLVEADATSLPFEDGSFYVAITSHVLHLIQDWKTALAEVRRVLRPTGVFFYCYQDSDAPVDRRDLNRQWEAILAAHGVHPRRERGGASKTDVMETLQAQGAQLETITAAQWRDEQTVGELVRLYAERVYSSTWLIPDEVFSTAIVELREWAGRHYESEDVPLPSDRRFELAVARHWSSV